MALVRKGGQGVILVEDEVMIAMHLQMMLEDAGLQVAGVAHAAEEALALADAVRPAAAVIDIRLGAGPNGIHVARRLREAHGCGVVFVSGERETVERAAGIEGSVFLRKPVTAKALVGSVRAALAGS